MIEFKFDPQKSARNRELHGVDLQWAIRLWDGDHAIVEGKFIREPRRVLLARYEGQCWAYEEKVERNANH